MSYIKEFNFNSKEWKRLEVVASILTELSPNGHSYYVGGTYFDFGQDWKWTTVLAVGKLGSYQALSPREQEEVLTSDGDDLYKICREVFADKYCPDRI